MPGRVVDDSKLTLGGDFGSPEVCWAAKRKSRCVTQIDGSEVGRFSVVGDVTI